MSRRIGPALVPALFLAALAVGVGVLAAEPASADGPRQIEIRIRYSRFEPAYVVVPAGQPVTFIIRNDDPIEHEWLVGDAAMHAVHRTGTEAHHASRPTEMSIPALSTGVTTVTFPEPVFWRFICHLPGHEAYGMVGTVDAR